MHTAAGKKTTTRLVANRAGVVLEPNGCARRHQGLTLFTSLRWPQLESCPLGISSGLGYNIRRRRLGPDPDEWASEALGVCPLGFPFNRSALRQ